MAGRQLLAGATRVVFFTGAGISTESGIPDFRSPGGIWTRMAPIDFDSFLASEAARRESWRRKFETDSIFRTASPNRGHRAVAELVRRGIVAAIITQNIDGLHHAAGSATALIVELHGNVREAKCLGCDWRGPMSETLERVRAGETDPRCVACGGILKSATVSFGESLVAADLERAIEAARGCDLFLAIGTSLGVYPANSLPTMALRHGARFVVMNAEPTPFDPHADVVVRAPLGEALPALVSRV